MKITTGYSVLKAAVLLAFIFCAIGSIAAISSDDFTPDPKILYPVSDTVDITGKDELVFRWSPFEGNIAERRFYDFTLFKGRQTYEKYVIVKKRLPPSVYSFAVKADMFEDGQAYTWTLSQAYFAKGKSDDAYCGFKVIKK